MNKINLMINEKITSVQNPLIKKIEKLGRSNSFRKKESLIILDGIHIIQEVLKTDKTQKIEQIFYTREGLRNKEISNIVEKIGNKRSIEVGTNVFQKISTTTNPTGIIASYKKPKHPVLKDENFIILLDHISDPGNMGTILRTGVSMGAKAFFCSRDCVDIWGSKVVRAAQGAHFYAKIFDNFDLVKIKDVFNGNILGTFLDENAKSLYKTDLTGKVALCFGNEGQGISSPIEKVCDQKIYIPMQNNFESLNVAISAGICCAEKVRQEKFATQ